MQKTLSQPIPESTLAIVILIGSMVAIWMIVRLFGNVESDKRRRFLQNFVYRLYETLRWFSAIVHGIDQGINAYYSTNEKTKISPMNERKFAPREVKPTGVTMPAELILDQPHLSSASGWNLIGILRGWNWRQSKQDSETAGTAEA